MVFYSLKRWNMTNGWNFGGSSRYRFLEIRTWIDHLPSYLNLTKDRKHCCSLETASWPWQRWIPNYYISLCWFSLDPQLITLDSWMSGEPSKNFAKINFNHVNSSPIPPKKLEMICLLPGETVFQGLMLHMLHSYVSTSRIVSLWNWQIEKDSVFQPNVILLFVQYFFGILSLSTMEVSHHFIRFSFSPQGYYK